MRNDDAVAMMPSHRRDDDRRDGASRIRTAVPLIATRIITRAVPAVVVPATVGLNGLHRRKMSQRGKSVAAHHADAGPGDANRRQGERHICENAQSLKMSLCPGRKSKGSRHQIGGLRTTSRVTDVCCRPAEICRRPLLRHELRQDPPKRARQCEAPPQRSGPELGRRAQRHGASPRCQQALAQQG